MSHKIKMMKTRGKKKRQKGVPYLIVLCMLVSMVSNASICGEFPPDTSDWESLTSYEGDYSNCTYGYSVSIPDGLIGRSSPPPSPQHGFGILLSKQPTAYLWIDGSYNSLEWESLEQAADQHIEWIEEYANILSLQKLQTVLHETLAIRFIVHYTCSDEDEVLVNDYILAIDERQIVYTIGLSASEENYDEYQNIVEELAKTWQFIESSHAN